MHNTTRRCSTVYLKPKKINLVATGQINGQINNFFQKLPEQAYKESYRDRYGPTVEKIKRFNKYSEALEQRFLETTENPLLKY